MSLIQLLSAKKELLKAHYIDLITYQYNDLVRLFGINFKGIANSHHYRMYINTISMNLNKVHFSNMPHDMEYAINSEKMEKNAAEYADSVINLWVDKINSKLGELDTYTINEYNSFGFIITGTRNNKEVTIIQSMITNISSHGLLFNQFPAKIYVDGKSLSAAKYEALFS